MVFFGHLAVGLFDFVVRGALLQPQDLIVVAFRLSHNGLPLISCVKSGRRPAAPAAGLPCPDPFG